MTDEELMLSVKNGDLDKAAILYERYRNNIYIYIRYKNTTTERCEDCVQQVFYRILKYRNTYKEGKSFKAWIYRIAQNVHSMDYNQEVIQDELRATYLRNEEYNVINDEHEAIQNALKLLPETYREVLLMSKFWGLKYENIAEINNCSVGVIKTRVFRAIKSLKEVYFKII